LEAPSSGSGQASQKEQGGHTATYFTQAMSTHTTAEERNALLDRDVRFARLSLEVEKMGHEVVKRVSQAQPKVEHVALDTVASWTKKETFAFEPYPHEDAQVSVGICLGQTQTLFGIRLRHKFAQDVLQDKLGAKISKDRFQSFVGEDGVPFLTVWNTNPDGSRSLLSWFDFCARRFQPLQACTPGESVFKAMEDWVRSQLEHDGHDLADDCVEKIEEWQDASGLYARRQFPQLYLPNDRKHPHYVLLQDCDAARLRTWLFGAKVSQGQADEWSQQLVTFTCTNDGQPSTIPCLMEHVDIALRSREAWAEMLQCDAGSYDDCLSKAMRDAHFMESPDEDCNNLHSWLTPKHKDPEAKVVQEDVVKDVASSQEVVDRCNLFSESGGHQTERTAWLAKTDNASEQAENMSGAKEEEYVVFVDGGQLEGSQGAAMQRMRELLQGLSLIQYAASFEKQGYDDVDSMREMTGVQLEEMMNCVQMVKPGHQERLKKWHETGAADSTPMHNVDSQLDAAADWQPPYHQQFQQYPAYGNQLAQNWNWMAYANQWAQNDMTPSTDQWGCQGWHAEDTHTQYLYWNSLASDDPECSVKTVYEKMTQYLYPDSVYIRMAKDPRGTMVLQTILREPPPYESTKAVSVNLMRVVAKKLNLCELMFNQHGIFLVQAFFKSLLSTSMPDVGEAEQCGASACDVVMENWNQLMLGRTSAFSYKMVMWIFELLYMKSSDRLQTFCRKALESAEQLSRSNYGHLVLQHAVLFTQKALVRASTPSRKEAWEYTRNGFFRAATEALRDKDAWEKKTNSASHFINKCLELISSDPTADRYRPVIIQTVLTDHALLGLICHHLSGQFTARRIYDLGNPRERKNLERQAWLWGARIDKPELRDLEKFKSSLLMPDEAAELDFPNLSGP